MRHNLINFLISCFNMSNDVLNARHFLGQLLISISASGDQVCYNLDLIKAAN